MLAEFPMTGEEDFGLLVESIGEGGLKVPVLLDGEGRVILHGRSRVLAYAAAGRDLTRIPRQLLPGNITYEAILDLILLGARESRHMLGLSFLDLSSLAQPFYAAAAVKRTRDYPRVRPHLPRNFPPGR